MIPVVIQCVVEEAGNLIYLATYLSLDLLSCSEKALTNSQLQTYIRTYNQNVATAHHFDSLYLK